MANTSVLNLERADTASTRSPSYYPERVEDDRKVNAMEDLVDLFAGGVSASFCDTFFVSGALGDHLGDPALDGYRYTRGARVITEVVGICVASGSGGVTRYDVQMQEVA